MDVLELPHHEARALLATGAPVFVLVNPPEFHGPHLSLRNDLLVATGLATDLHARLAEEHKDWPFLTAGRLDVGCDVVPGPGAVETPFRTVRRLVVDACTAAAKLGAKRVVVMTFHGGPNHNVALHAGVRALEGLGVQALAPLNLLLREMLELDPRRFSAAFAHVEDPVERQALEDELGHDFHAGFFETSMALHYAPGTVAPLHRALPPCAPVKRRPVYAGLSRVVGALGARTLARELDFAAWGTGWFALRPFPGYTGRPAHASPTAGAVFAREILDRYTACAREVFGAGRRGPRPIMSWLPGVTLGGRVGHPTVAPKDIQVEAPAPRRSPSSATA